MVGALFLVVAAGGLWGTWHWISKKPAARAKDVEPALGETTTDIPFQDVDADVEDAFVMIVQTEGPWKDGPEILDKVIAQVILCDEFAAESLDAEYPGAVGKKRIVRVQCDRWPGDFEWTRLREAAAKVARVTLEVVGPRGIPRIVPARGGS